jgi:hypothetical protein
MEAAVSGSASAGRPGVRHRVCAAVLVEVVLHHRPRPVIAYVPGPAIADAIDHLHPAGTVDAVSFRVVRTRLSDDDGSAVSVRHQGR